MIKIYFVMAAVGGALVGWALGLIILVNPLFGIALTGIGFLVAAQLIAAELDDTEHEAVDTTESTPTSTIPKDY